MVKAEPPIGFAQWRLAWRQLMTCGLSIPGWLPSFPDEGSVLVLLPTGSRSQWLCCVDGKAVLLSVLLGFASEGSVFHPLLLEVMVTHINVPSAFLASSPNYCHRAPDLREP